jgi:hypothetical protein
MEKGLDWKETLGFVSLCIPQKTLEKVIPQYGSDTHSS